MPIEQSPEAQAFIDRIAALPSGPGVSLDEALQPSLDDESSLRRIFATDKSNPRLSNPLVGLVDLFQAPPCIRTTRARIPKDDEDLAAHYVMPLSPTNRRPEGVPSTVESLDEFKKNWAIFTEGSLSQLLDWGNVVAAGGSVLACLTPLPEEARKTKRGVRKYFHGVAYPSSDVDLFLWGMTPEEAEKKIIAIFEAVRDSVPWDVTCVRTQHTVSIHSQYPYRSIQIVLRLYASPAEILAGFDIDAPCCAYDGSRVYASPRAITAMMRQANTVDVTRRSPSYEVRLAKYSGRAYEVYVPGLKRDEIDPTIFERSISRIQGLARLLVLEKLTSTDARFNFLESRRNLRGRPNPLSQYNSYRRRKRALKGDLKAELSSSGVIGGLEMNDYDVASLHIPYGPGWNARRVEKLVYQTDLGMNSTFNPKNKGRRLHRHPAFFGTMEECIEDCCENCPKPIDEDERKLQEEEDKNYIRGRISFIEENPGRQTLSGSFNPIDDTEWSEQVYVKPMTRLFEAIASKNRRVVQEILKKSTSDATSSDRIDINTRDHVGRSPLHVAILSRASDIACDLIDAGARMTARLVDGKSSLHLACEANLVDVATKILEKSDANALEAIKKEDDVEEPLAEEKKARDSSEDDWSSEEADDEDSDGDEDEEGSPKKKEAKAESPPISESQGDIPEDAVNEPDVVDINLPDWDFGFTPICYAVLFGSLPLLNILISAKADVKFVTKAANTYSTPFHPLTLTLLRAIDNEDEACKIAERLILAGASCTTADESMHTIFHSAVCVGNTKLVATMLRCDPNAGSVIDFPAITRGATTFPLASAIQGRDYAVVAVLLAYGAKLVFTEEDITRAREAGAMSNRKNLLSYGIIKSYLDQVYMPVETALQNHDDFVQVLLALGAPFNIATMSSLQSYSQPASRRTNHEWVQMAIVKLQNKIEDEIKSMESETTDVEDDSQPTALVWKDHLERLYRAGDIAQKYNLKRSVVRDGAGRSMEHRIHKLKEVKEYMVDVERVLTALGAKAWKDVHPDIESTAKPDNESSNAGLTATKQQGYVARYATINVPHAYLRNYIPRHQDDAYDELYQACFTGDNEKVQQLCLPAKGGSKSITSLLNISVETIYEKHPRWSTGYTPLFAAIAGRQWSTAKLVLGICTAQYHPEDEKEAKFKLDIDEDSDNESDASDDTVEQREIKFVDIANRPSTVQSDIHPKVLLSSNIRFWIKGPVDNDQFDQRDGNMLQKAVEEKDLEAFTNIANLYQCLPQELELPDILPSILSADQPDILDEYIRRTGHGIDYKVSKKDNTAEEEIFKAVNDKNRIYLGLNVHGKKRMDLARKNDPNAVYQHQDTTYILWRAIDKGAKLIIEYLAGERPLAAYRFFSSTKGDERALRLRRTVNLDEVLPEWLGWTITEAGESPLAAAIIRNELDIVKLLFKKAPRIMADATPQKIKFIGFNPILQAAQTTGCAVDIIDFLLEKSVSPAEKDLLKGYNIYHYLSNRLNDNEDLLEHLFQKLPRDVNETLLLQQSKGRLNTPLHIAVKSGAIRAVQLILEYTQSPSILFARDVDGSTALHIAASYSFVDIAKLLIAAGPAGSESLFMENGVGQTPIEIACLKELTSRVRGFTYIRVASLNCLNDGNIDVHPDRYDIAKSETQLPKLKKTIEMLNAEGKLNNKTKLALELNTFLATMEGKLIKAKTTEEEFVKKRKAEDDKLGNSQKMQAESDPPRALAVIAKAVEESTVTRQLIHLIDVQKSVQAGLTKSTKVAVKPEEQNAEEGLDPENNEDKDPEQALMLFKSYHYHNVDLF